MSPPTDVSGFRSSRDATIDAIVLALGLRIQAMLVERKAVERVLGCDADETVLDAATRVAGDLASAEKQIDDVRDVLKAKVGELTVDAATHAIILAQNHATLVKQVEQMERLLKEQDKENAEFKTCWHEMGVTLGCMLTTALLLPSRSGDTEFRSWDVPGGPELMLEAAKRVVKERDEARRDLASAREASAAWQAVRNVLKPADNVESIAGAADRVVRERDAYRIRAKDMESDVCKMSAERDEAKALAVTLAKERDDARAVCVAVAAEISALPDEPVLAAAKRVAQDLRDEVGEARQARRDRDQALAELNAVRRILPPMNDRETTVDAAKRVAERRDEARADAGRMMKDLDDVRTVLEAKFGETAVDAAKRVVADAHAVADAAREVQRTARVVSQTQEAISDLEQKASERATAAILEALGARAGEKAIDVANRVVKERDELRDAFQTQRDQARKELEKVRLLLSPKGSWESTADATARVIKERIEAIRDRDRALAALADTSSVVATRIREALGAKSDERTEEAAKRVVMERDAAQASSRRFADVVRGVSATLGAREDEDAVTAAKRVVKERHDLRDELDKRMSL